jgi:hypothetical protein
MENYKIATVIFAFIISIGLYADDTMLNNSNNYLLQCAMLPFTKVALADGEATVEIVNHSRKDNEEDIAIKLSPGDIITSYKIKDGIILSMTASHNNTVLFSSELTANKEKIFPFCGQGDWATPISSSLSIALQDINIITRLSSFLNDDNKSCKLKLKKAATGKGKFAYDLLLPDNNLIRKYYWGEDGFLVEDYIANKKEKSFEFDKNNIRFSIIGNYKGIETSFMDGVLILAEKKGVIKKYDKEGNILPMPPFNLKIKF